MNFQWTFSLTIALSFGIVAVAAASNDATLQQYVLNAPESGGLSTSSDVNSRVERILLRTPLIDGHNDLAIFIRYSYNNHIYGANFTTPFQNGDLGQHADLARLKEGRVGGTFWCAFAFCWADETGPSDQYYAQALAETNAELDILKRLQDAYPDTFDLSADSNTILTAVQSGKIASPLCVEGLHLIGNSTAILRHFYSLGVRYITLTYNCHNLYADAAIVDLAAGGSAAAKPYWYGISPTGRDVVREINRLGMIVDLSYISVETIRNVLGGSPEKG
ncbi:hypothetical protein B7494_g2154 [Chlorociboria aeruginascens]|nr:hypothetical protein B7494_g2154 [Chlorociboria aeruginascens]